MTQASSDDMQINVQVRVLRRSIFIDVYFIDNIHHFFENIIDINRISGASVYILMTRPHC